MKVTLLLADFAQVVDGKLYVMGGGWSATGPQPAQSALAMKIEVPWTSTNQKHSFKFELVDGDYHPVLLPTANGESPVVISGNFEVGRPVGMAPGTPLDVPVACNIPPLPLSAGKRYVWKLEIDGNSNDDWQVAFSTRPHVNA